jgi:hypothetical protein
VPDVTNDQAFKSGIGAGINSATHLIMAAVVCHPYEMGRLSVSFSGGIANLTPGYNLPNLPFGLLSTKPSL